MFGIQTKTFSWHTGLSGKKQRDCFKETVENKREQHMIQKNGITKLVLQSILLPICWVIVTNLKARLEENWTSLAWQVDYWCFGNVELKKTRVAKWIKQVGKLAFIILKAANKTYLNVSKWELFQTQPRDDLLLATAGRWEGSGEVISVLWYNWAT